MSIIQNELLKMVGKVSYADIKVISGVSEN